MSTVAKKVVQTISAPNSPMKTKGRAQDDEICKTKLNIVSPEIKRGRAKAVVKKTEPKEDLVVKSVAVVDDESSVDERIEVETKAMKAAAKKSTKTVLKKETEPVPEQEEAVEEQKEETNKFKSRVEILPQVKKVYQYVNQMTGALGGNGYNGAIYGELTVGSMQKVINFLVDKCEMDHTSRFIDVGAGLGKPNLHASQSPGVRLSIGVELEHIRWQLSMHNLDLFLTKFLEQDEDMPVEERLNDGINFLVNDIDNATSMDPFTHIYMYDLGFPPPLQQSIARKFNNSVHARYLVSYRPPKRVIEEYGYSVEFVDKHDTKMFGSGESHTAYFYKRIGSIPSTPKLPNQRRLFIPKRTNFREEEEDEEVTCDAAFYEAAVHATQDVNALRNHVKLAVDAHLNGARAKRTPKPRVVS